MHTFKDSEGREWRVRINVNTIERVRGIKIAGTHVDLYKLADDGFKPLSELCADPCKLVQVLYAILDPEKVGVTAEQFGEAFAGDALHEATVAFAEELLDFFPEARTRDLLRKALAKGREVKDRMLDQGEKLIAEIQPEAEAAKIIETLAQEQKRKSGNAPASSALTPAV